MRRSASPSSVVSLPSTLRCCADLRRMADRRSRSSGFPAPPPTLHLAVWPLASSGDPPSGRFPFRLGSVPGLALTLEDLAAVTVQASRPVCDHRAFVLSLLPAGCSPLQRSQSGDSTSRRCLPSPVSPARLAPLRFARDLPASPRRGVPLPLWAAFAVSHDLDGLPFPEPCDLFQPLTLVGFVFLLPDAGCPATRPRGSEELHGRARGMGDLTEGSRLVVVAGARLTCAAETSPGSPWLSGDAFALPGRL
jgi:hypothetical protein